MCSIVLWYQICFNFFKYVKMRSFSIISAWYVYVFLPKTDSVLSTDNMKRTGNHGLCQIYYKEIKIYITRQYRSNCVLMYWMVVSSIPFYLR